MEVVNFIIEYESVFFLAYLVIIPFLLKFIINKTYSQPAT